MNTQSLVTDHQVLGIGTLIFSLALLGMGLATSYWHLVLCRMLIAAGEAVCRFDPLCWSFNSLLFQADVWISFGRPLPARVKRPRQRHLFLGGRKLGTELGLLFLTRFTGDTASPSF